ncbi:hypothetical protein J132_04138, partial [Termitomyces sp. J132]
STGKTTLVGALALKLGLNFPAVVKEVARNIMMTQGFSRDDVNSLKMQHAILVAQLEREKEGRECPIQICDRSAVDPIVYAVLTSNTAEEARIRRNFLVNSPMFQAALEVYRQSTFLLLAPIPEWLVDDGVRLIEKQNQYFGVFKTELQRLGINFRIIGQDMRSQEERVVWVLGLLRC